jgi:hypothetical protein
MNKKNVLHNDLVKRVGEEFSEKNFLVETEVELPFGQGAVDIYAHNDEIKIYIEVKSSPQSIDSKKVQKQLQKYKKYFGKENLYCLISPDSRDNPRICSLDRRINCSLDTYLSKI